MRKGYIFITKSGYDPGAGKHVKDPYLGDIPTIGACRPDLRKRVEPKIRTRQLELLQGLPGIV